MIHEYFIICPYYSTMREKYSLLSLMVLWYGSFLKWGYLQIIHVNFINHLFWGTPSVGNPYIHEQLPLESLKTSWGPDPVSASSLGPGRPAECAEAAGDLDFWMFSGPLEVLKVEDWSKYIHMYAQRNFWHGYTNGEMGCCFPFNNIHVGGMVYYNILQYAYYSLL